MQPQPQYQPRTYRIKLFDGYREELRDRHFIAVLDFSPGPMLWATNGQLDALAFELTYKAGARGMRALDYHLEVTDELTGEFRCHWPAKTWAKD